MMLSLAQAVVYSVTLAQAVALAPCKVTFDGRFPATAKSSDLDVESKNPFRVDAALGQGISELFGVLCKGSNMKRS